MILKLKDPSYRAYFITLPTHPKKLDAVILGILRKGLFLLEISEMSCFYEVVYGVEQDRRDTAERFLTLKPHIAACVQTVYIDCHWIGYVAVTTRPDGLWKVKPVYKADDTGDAPFDFCAFRKEVHLYLEGWTNLKHIVLLKPEANQTFLSVLYAETKRVVTDFKKTLHNPHHVRVSEVLNDGVTGIDYTRRALAFYENARAL